VRRKTKLASETKRVRRNKTYIAEASEWIEKHRAQAVELSSFFDLKICIRDRILKSLRKTEPVLYSTLESLPPMPAARRGKATPGRVQKKQCAKTRR
jgi:hypothetical protein